MTMSGMLSPMNTNECNVASNDYERTITHFWDGVGRRVEGKRISLERALRWDDQDWSER